MRTKQNGGKNFLIKGRRLSHTMHRQGAGTAREKELPDADTCILFDIWIHPKRRIVKRRESFSVRKNIRRGAGCLCSPPFARLWQISDNIVAAGFPGPCGTRSEAVGAAATLQSRFACQLPLHRGAFRLPKLRQCSCNRRGRVSRPVWDTDGSRKKRATARVAPTNNPE